MVASRNIWVRERLLARADASAMIMVRLEVTSTSVLNAPKRHLTCSASAAKPPCANWYSTKAVINPPKTRISDARNHQIAILPIGISRRWSVSTTSATNGILSSVALIANLFLLHVAQRAAVATAMGAG